MEVTNELLIKLYTEMVRVRKLDEKTIECLFCRASCAPFFTAVRGRRLQVWLCART